MAQGHFGDSSMLLAFALPLAGAIAAEKLNLNGKLGRVWFVVIVALCIVIGYSSFSMGDTAILTFETVLGFVLSWSAISRARSAGSKLSIMIYLSAVPVINLPFLIYLTALPEKARALSSSDNSKIKSENSSEMMTQTVEPSVQSAKHPKYDPWEAVNKLGELMEKYSSYYLDTKFLPLPKTEMKAALKTVWTSAKTQEQRDHIEFGYCETLSTFMDGIGDEPIRIGGCANATPSYDDPDIKRKMKKITDDLEVATTMMDRSMKESLLLRDEFVEFKRANSRTI